MSETVIKVSNLSKKYRIGYREKKNDTLFGRMGDIIKSPVSNFRKIRDMANFSDNGENVHWALKDIDFEVKEGQVLGIIGHNGAGKSTLLKILSRITPPSIGEIEITGRVSSLLEVGTGFHSELTGRDNIYMNGTIHGMTRREIASKLDEIVDFSGVEKYIDTPVKFYSSGMKVRLGFAVAASLEPEILIIDEVLAVGDAEFQKKCIGKMKDVADHGRTILFVSHDMGAVKNLCPETIILKGGRIFDRDESEKAIIRYMEDLATFSAGENNSSKIIEVREMKVQGKQALNKAILKSNRSIVLEVMVNSAIDSMEMSFGFDIFNSFGVKIMHLRSDAQQKFRLENGLNKLLVEFDYVPLLSGTYHVNGWIAEYKGKRIWEHTDLLLLEVIPDNTFYDHQGHLKNALLVPAVNFSVHGS